MSRFHLLTIDDVRRETPDCVSVAFDVPQELQDRFTYKAGQNITLRIEIAGEELRRSYSICQAYQPGRLRVAIKRIPGGRFSNYANDNFRVGQQIEVMPPTGRFTLPDSCSNTDHFVGIAAGSGITPIMAMIETVLLESKDTRFTLLYGNRTTHSIVFREALENLKNRFLNRLQVWHVLSREQTDVPLTHGRIDAGKLSTIFTKLVPADQVTGYYLCGPVDMVDMSRQTLKNLGVDPNNIHVELFGTPAVAAQTQHVTAVASQEMSHIKMRLDDLTLQFELPYNGVSILDAATAAGADVPFSCKGGVCATCRAKLLHGTVDMRLNYALEPHELAAGYILTCQSHPTSAQVEVDYDA
jgi:ring-1,2-phenylacetyl-CoA epoxidase subunit PaaE